MHNKYLSAAAIASLVYAGAAFAGSYGGIQQYQQVKQFGQQQQQEEQQLPAGQYDETMPVPSWGGAQQFCGHHHKGCADQQQQQLPAQQYTGGEQQVAGQYSDPADPSVDVERDTRVFSIVHHINQTEIDMGNLAQQRATRQDVKDYGKMLVDDHQKADQELLDLAKRGNFQIRDLDSSDAIEGKILQQDADNMKKLEGIRGADWDREFLNQMVTGHQQAIEFLKGQRDQLQDKDHQQFVDQLLPVLQRHLDRAQELLKAEGTTPEPRP